MLAALVSALGAFGALLWIGFGLAAAWNRGKVARLAGLPADEPPGGWPSVALIFAARDEAATVEAAARSMLRLDYPGLRIIAVDDRSRDATGAILDRLAAEDRRLDVIHVAALPEGWLGKTHALQAAADRADAAWLLLTDADVVFAPGALRRAVALAEREGLDHLTVAPEVTTHGFGERVFLPMFQAALTLYAPSWRIEDPGARAAIGIGAFNLVRAEAFRAIGGFRRLALSVDDDIQLGRALKWSGRRGKLVLGARDVAVRWQVGLAGMIRGLEKNFFAGARFRVGRVAVFCLGMIVLGVLPHAGLFVGPVPARLVCGLGVLAACGVVHQVGAQSGVRWYYGLLLPLSTALCIAALLRSTWLTLRQGGIRWRGHLYPLDDLRRHVWVRDLWMRELWRSTR
jgi:hypothetical protein